MSNKFNEGDSVYHIGDSSRKVGKITNIHKSASITTYIYTVEFSGDEAFFCEYEIAKCYSASDYAKPYKVPVCECGAIKVHGEKASIYHHALWCDLGK